MRTHRGSSENNVPSPAGQFARSFTDELAAQLHVRGVPARAQARIVAEIEDHLDCDPSAAQRLGTPALLATAFADELGADAARTGARNAFAALTLTAAALGASQLSTGAAGGYPGIGDGASVALSIPALLMIVVGAQVALVAGCLAALRAFRRRAAATLPAAEVALVRSRTVVALAGGLATAAGLLLYVADFAAVVPAWWLGLTGGLAGAAATAVLAAWRRLASTRGLVLSGGGPSGGIQQDLPLLGHLAERPWLLAALGSTGVGAAVTVAAWHAESSLAEGLQRGVFEAIAATAGFVLLGRAIGARR